MGRVGSLCALLFPQLEIEGMGTTASSCSDHYILVSGLQIKSELLQSMRDKDSRLGLVIRPLGVIKGDTRSSFRLWLMRILCHTGMRSAGVGFAGVLPTRNKTELMYLLEDSCLTSRHPPLILHPWNVTRSLQPWEMCFTEAETEILNPEG